MAVGASTAATAQFGIYAGWMAGMLFGFATHHGIRMFKQWWKPAEVIEEHEQ